MLRPDILVTKLACFLRNEFGPQAAVLKYNFTLG